MYSAGTRTVWNIYIYRAFVSPGMVQPMLVRTLFYNWICMRYWPRFEGLNFGTKHLVFIIIIIIIIRYGCLCHRHFFPVLLLNQRWSPPLTLQASHCSTFRIMCDVPSIAVFCCESIECFPGTVSKFFLKLLVTIPVAHIITGTLVHFRIHIRFISIRKI